MIAGYGSKPDSRALLTVAGSKDRLVAISGSSSASCYRRQPLRSRHLRTFAVFGLHEAGAQILEVPVQRDRSAFAVIVGSHSFLPPVVVQSS